MDDTLLTDAYWEDRVPDLRLNPVRSWDSSGLESFVRAEERLAGHVLFATSGSGGEPKLVALSKEALMASARMVNAAIGEGEWFVALPTFHVGGYGMYARAFVAGGRVTRFEGEWDPKRFGREVEGIVSLVPTQVYDLVSARVIGVRSATI